MKFKNTKNKSIDIVGEFQKFKITVESEGELALLMALVGNTRDADDDTFSLKYNSVRDIFGELYNRRDLTKCFGKVSFEK